MLTILLIVIAVLLLSGFGFGRSSRPSRLVGPGTGRRELGDQLLDDFRMSRRGAPLRRAPRLCDLGLAAGTRLRVPDSFSEPSNSPNEITTSGSATSRAW